MYGVTGIQPGTIVFPNNETFYIKIDKITNK